MKILGLYSSEDGYNMTANLLSDKNDVFGLRITVYGESENIIKEEIDLSGESLLKQFDDALNVFERTYTYEKINDTSRQRVERIPLDVFREALADSLIHRSWEANEHTQVSFYPDSIWISSPKGLTYKGFDLRSRDMRFLTLKNPTLSFVFYRLGLVHDFVMRAAKFDHYYEKSYRKPEFNINSYSFNYYLPAIVTTVVLTKQEMDLLKEMNFDEPYSRSDLEENLGINKATLIRLLNSLIKKGVIIKEGKSSATTYLKVR